MTALCEHGVPNPAYMVVPGAPRGVVRFKCPCCRLEGWQHADDPTPIDEDNPCPYCGVQAVLA